MDRGDNENELKQVIGDIQSAHNIGADDILILGRDGMLFAGPNSRRHEPLLLFYLSLLVRDMFIRVFFVRTFVLDDMLKTIRRLIMEHETDPNNIPKVRSHPHTPLRSQPHQAPSLALQPPVLP
jgi:WD repeat-containing protein 35